MTIKRILIIGATSAIATATARRYAAHGAAFHLVARDGEHLMTVARDLELRGASKVSTAVADLLDADQHAMLIDAAVAELGTFDLVLIAHGVLPDQRRCEFDPAALRAVFAVNTLSTLSLLTLIANRCETQGHGTIAVVSSVAGDRGRQSNYVYGASKAAIDVFLGGLRNRLTRAGVQVLTIKPGFVDTPMTAAFAKGPLWATPALIAEGIERAVARRLDVVYLPWFWWIIMLVIRTIPERLFKRLSL